MSEPETTPIARIEALEKAVKELEKRVSEAEKGAELARLSVSCEPDKVV